MLLPIDDDLIADNALARTPAAQRILDAASELFYRRGIHVVGVDLVAEQAGTTKKTLYDRFGSKDGLVADYLTHRAHRWRAVLRESLPDGRTPPALTVFDVLERWLAEHDRGCGFVNAYAELGGADRGRGVLPALQVVRAEKRWMRRLFAATLVDAEQDGHRPAADELATQLHVLYEGATVLATVSPGTGAVPAARAAAAHLIEAW